MDRQKEIGFSSGKDCKTEKKEIGWKRKCFSRRTGNERMKSGNGPCLDLCGSGGSQEKLNRKKEKIGQGRRQIYWKRGGL